MGIDTRGRKRRLFDGPVEFSIHEVMNGGVKLNIPGREVKTNLIDISTTGCAISSPYFLPPKTLVELAIDNTSLAHKGESGARRCIKAVGRVTSCAMKGPACYRLGVLFMEIDQQDKRLIEEFIEAKDKEDDSR